MTRQPILATRGPGVETVKLFPAAGFSSMTQVSEQQVLDALRRIKDPDRGGDMAEFQRVKKAYEQLNKVRRGRCPVCKGKGVVEKRHGFFVNRTNCPKCWRIGK